jgi:2,5-diamino-6-(ribosylamino)-4(3H)-pyrimidinone 5'-phosphate reductase
MELHYQIAGSYLPDAHLIGSNTIRIGIELYGEGIPSEEEKDFHKPQRTKDHPYWVIPDTRGMLKGLLHTCRRFELCRDVVVLISKSTPREYIDYLSERIYDYHIVGADRVDLAAAFEILSQKYQVETIVADTGRLLGNLLLAHGFVSEISLLIHPIIVGKDAYNIFGNITKHVSLELQKRETFDNDHLWIVYRVKNRKMH